MFSQESLTWQKVLSLVQSRLGRAADHSCLIFSKTSGGIESYEEPVSIIAGYEVSSPGFYIGLFP
jgi:hypothetical protein